MITVLLTYLGDLHVGCRLQATDLSVLEYKVYRVWAEG